MTIRNSAIRALLAFLFVPYLFAATLSESTLAAWERHVQAAKAELTNQPYVRYSGGSTVPQVSGGVDVVPSGLIHHWTGTVFIPNVRIFDVLAILQDYDGYSDLYAPAVVESKLMSRNQNEFTYRMKFIQRDFGIKSGLLGTFRTTYHRMSGEAAGYSVTEATELVELRNPGTSGEETISQKEAHGYVERTFTIVRYGQYENGVVMKVENLSLSRGVPAAVRWMVEPLIERFSRRTMTSTLERLLDHVQTTQASASASGR